MKLRILFVTTLLLLGCGFAPAQTFGFMSTSGDLYCNYEQLDGNPNGLWSVTVNFSVCGSPNISVIGVSTQLTKAGNPGGFPLKGVAYDIYEAFSYTNNAQLLTVSNLKCSTKHYGWIGIAAESGFMFGDDYGFLSCTIPGRDAVPTKGRSTGNIKVPKRK